MVFTISSAGSAYYYYIQTAVTNLRECPTDKSKVVSQAIFSEEISLNTVEGMWAHITTSDGYQGWALKSSLVNRIHPYDATLMTTRVSAHIFRTPDVEYGPIITVPFGSHLKCLDSYDPRWIKVELPDGQLGFIQKGDVTQERRCLSKATLSTFSYQFLGLPYTWGGRSSFGYDCSGFIQMLYKQIGIQLQRDARQQIKDERFHEVEIDQIEKGDLIFFGHDAQRINHVGMSLGKLKFIHATTSENKPWIRISSLDQDTWQSTQSRYRSVKQLRNIVPI